MLSATNHPKPISRVSVCISSPCPRASRAVCAYYHNRFQSVNVSALWLNDVSVIPAVRLTKEGELRRQLPFFELSLFWNLLLNVEPAVEPFYTALCIDDSLLTCVERVAFFTYLNLKLRLS